jgi:glycosyltransferase involved in cell wall biosynthesis
MRMTRPSVSVNTVRTSPFAFVMPVYADRSESLDFLVQAIEGMQAQSDPQWKAIIVNDCSPQRDVVTYLEELQTEYGSRIEVIHMPENVGQGICRNIGIGRALALHLPVVLFNDADDVSHPERVRTVRDVLMSEPDVGCVYSSLRVINEHSQPVPYERLPPPIQEILDSHVTPVEGAHAWIRIATETGYTTSTSSTSVCTRAIAACPFPATRVSEDSHTWLRLSASGVVFRFAPCIPSSYRIPSFVKSQSIRDRLGGTYQFNRGKIVTDSEGFFAATNLALARGDVGFDCVPDLAERFLLRLARSMRRDLADDIADKLESAAATLRTTGLSALAANPRLLLEGL